MRSPIGKGNKDGAIRFPRSSGSCSMGRWEMWRVHPRDIERVFSTPITSANFQVSVTDADLHDASRDVRGAMRRVQEKAGREEGGRK